MCCKAVGKTTLTFSANVNILSVSTTLPACWYHAKRKISGKYVHGNKNYSRCFTRARVASVYTNL
jgi:hypothetical protein